MSLDMVVSGVTLGASSRSRPPSTKSGNYEEPALSPHNDERLSGIERAGWLEGATPHWNPVQLSQHLLSAH